MVEFYYALIVPFVKKVLKKVKKIKISSVFIGLSLKIVGIIVVEFYLLLHNYSPKNYNYAYF